MLERSAASLEPCSLQRVLPSTRTCLRTRRQLHTAFWHHGATELFLLDACRALVRLPPLESKAHAPPPKHSNRPEKMTASAHLLDFLYPRGTAALTRRLYPLHPRLQPGPRTESSMMRLFTSATTRWLDQPSNSRREEELAEDEAAEHHSQSHHFPAPDGVEGEEAEEEPELAAPEALRKLLGSERAGVYDKIFQLYSNLDPSQQEYFKTEVLLAMSPSGRPIEAWRINEIFAQYQIDEWTEELVVAAVKAQLTLHNVSEAMQVFRTALEQRGFGRALDYLAAYALELSSWDVLLESWQLYSTLKVDELMLEPAAWRLEEPADESTAVREAEPAVQSALGQGAESVPESTPTPRADDMGDSATPRDPVSGVESETAKGTVAVVEPRPVQGSQPMTESIPAQGTESALGLTAAQDSHPVAESSAAQKHAEPALESAVVHGVEAVVGPTPAPETGSGVDSAVMQDTEPVAESNGQVAAQDLDHVVKPATLQDTQAASESTAVQAAATDAELKAAQVIEPGPRQDAEPVDERMAEQDADPSADTTAVQDIEAATRPAAVEDARLVADSKAVQDDGSIADATPGHNPESLPNDGPAAEHSDGPTITYPRLAAMENFEPQVKSLYRFLKNHPESLPQRTGLVDSFLKHIAMYSLNLFRPSDAVFILDRVQDSILYEHYIILNLRQERKRLAGDLYKKYRAFPNVRVADSVLRAMVDAFFPHDVRGMELLLADWYRNYGRLDERGYQKFMSFYGRRGDVKSIMRLAAEYASHYGIAVEEDRRFVTNLMHAHAVRGDAEAARRVMEEAAEKSGEGPDLKQWNVLLHAYAKAGDYEGAIELFRHICEELEPDGYTFATIMGMAGWRGDLQFNLDLYQLAKERNIRPRMAMMGSLVEAYCQNDRFPEAERLCLAITKKRDMEGDYTYLWNTLLHHNAKRRDLATVNRLLDFMSSQGLVYNQDTYSYLLLALLYCRQSHHAMHLLRVAHHEGVFQPTPDHFVLLMSAFINSGEPHMALKTNELMAKLNYPKSVRRMTKVIDALGRWQELPSTKRWNVDGHHFLKRIMREFYKAMSREDHGAADDIRSVSGLYSKVLFILTQMREFATVHQIIRLHNTRYPARADAETIPLRLLHNIMLADFFEKKYDRVKETWNLVLDRTTRRYQPGRAFLNKRQEGEDVGDDHASSSPVVYARRFSLCDPLKTMQRLYLAEEDADGLLDLVATVRRRGFDLDSKNWNYHVQALATLKRWREAFTVCERVLMPQWMGWNLVRAKEPTKNALPLELRRMGRNPARPRPIAHTLLTLAKEYMDLEQMMLWSHEASKEFEYVTQNCPKTVRAVTTMIRTGSALEKQVFGDENQDAVAEMYREEGFYSGEEEDGLDEEEAPGIVNRETWRLMKFDNEG